MHAMHADDLVEYKKLFGLILMPNLKRNEALREKELTACSITMLNRVFYGQHGIFY